MQKIFLTGMLVAGLLAPVATYAQPASATIAASDGKPGRVFVMQSAQVLAIGAGVIVGAVVAEAVISTRIALLVGGVAGGYLANLWYTGRDLEIHVDTPPKL